MQLALNTQNNIQSAFSSKVLYKSNKTQSAKNPSFKSGFTREIDGWTYGGISIWDDDAQRMITKNFDEDMLQKFFKLLDMTTNNRILGLDIRSDGKYIKRLTARFWCSYYLKDFTEHFKQKFVGESPWEFFCRAEEQYNKYYKQLVKGGVNLYK